MENVQWKTHSVLIGLELTKPTLENLHTAIDGHWVRGASYHHLVGSTGYGSLLLLDFPEDPLPLSEMLFLYDDAQICIWWGQCPPTEAMDLLFQKHQHSESEPCTPAPFAYGYGREDNRDDPNPDTVASEEPEDPVRSEPTVRLKLPVRRRLVLGPLNGCEIKCGLD